MYRCTEKDNFIIVRKHFLMLLFSLLKFALQLLILFICYYYFDKYLSSSIDDQSMNYTFFVILIIVLNYVFIKLILSIIIHYNNLIIITDEHILILEASLIMKDDLEVIDSYKVTKVDVYTRWVISNLIWYWTLVIEQQRDSVREFHFIPTPHKVMAIITKQREAIIEERQKQYIVTEENQEDATL